MKSKILNLLLILTSLIGYLEWNGNNHVFLFQAEFDIFLKLFTNPASVLHPLIIMPLIAQVLLIYTLFRKNPSKFLTYISIGCLGLLLGLMFVIGIMNLNLKIIFSTIPFIVVSVLTIIYYRKITLTDNK